MAKPYSQGLRDRVIDAVKRGEARPPRSSAPSVRDQRVEQDGSREPASDTAAIGLQADAAPGLSWRPRGPRNRTSRFRLCAIAFRPSEGSKPTPR